MAYSGAVGTTVFNIDKVLRSAVRRCKLPAAQITSEQWSIAQDQLFLFCNELTNMGVPLWCIERQLYPLYLGAGALTMDIGTVDVLNSNFRTTSEVTGTDTDSSTVHKVEFESATSVSTVGVFWAGASVPIALERSDDDITWETIQTETVTASAGEVSWFDLESMVPSLYFRVRALSGVLSFDRIYLGNNISRIPLARLNRDDFSTLPNPAFLSDRVLQFWFDRQTPRPIMRLWPLPSDGALTCQIEVWRHRQIMNVGTLTQELEFPQRWYETVVSGLARKLARELIEVDPKVIPQLDADAANSMRISQAEERDNSVTRWQPNIQMYTA